MTRRTPSRRPPGHSRRALLAGGGAALALGLAGRGAQAQGGPPAPSLRTLVALPSNVALGRPSAPPLPLWTLDGTIPGPTLRLRHGETLRLRLENRIEKPLSLHWHGLRQASALDGVGGFSNPPVAPGASHEWSLTPPDSGLFLYRPLSLGGSAEPAERGLTGLLIVEEREPPKVDHDIPLVVDDWLIAPEGQLAPFQPGGIDAAAAGRLGNWLTVSGRPLPNRMAFRPGARLRLRLANVCNARTLRIRFDNLKAYVAAIDGQPTDVFEPLRSTLPFAPGTRYDILVDLPEDAAAKGAIVALIGEGLPLFEAITEGEPLAKERPPLPPIAPLPANPALPPAVRLQDAVRPELVIAGGVKIGPDGRPDATGLDLSRPWTLNGKASAAGMPPLFTVRRGTPIVLALVNRTAFPQPLHVHGHVFRMLHPLDDGWEPYFLDTIILPEGRTTRIAFIADNPGRWLVSSSVLERFDAGLWSWFEVT